MCWVIVGGEVLVGFDLFLLDDYVKLFFFNVEGQFVVLMMMLEGLCYFEGQVLLLVCDYMLCWWDLEVRELVLDFVMYGYGVVLSWVVNVQLGDVIVVGGLWGLYMIVQDFDIYVLIGDEMVLLVIGCWLEMLLVMVQVDVYIEIFELVDCQVLLEDDCIWVLWLECNGFDVVSSMLLEDVLIDFEMFDGDMFYWIVVELCWVWMMCKYIEGYLGVLKVWICLIGYWKVYVDEYDGD